MHMRVAVVGSRNLTIEISKYIPKDMVLLISGGARGIDSLAEKYADNNGISKLIFKPDYKKYEEKAPLIRNKLIVQNADLIIAIWNGVSTGTKFTIDYAKSLGKKIKLFLIDTETEIMPGNLGKDCHGNGKTIECCCDECEYLQCCIDEEYPHECADCPDKYCPRKFS